MNQDTRDPTRADERGLASEREALSALVDGELPAGELGPLVKRWGASPDLQQAWHCHQVIGDALRSDELAGHASEARFLAGLRERLALEPVVLAPTPRVDPPAAPMRRRRPVWATGAAVAAGFAAVATVLLSLQFPSTETTLAGGPAPLPALKGALPGGAVPVEWVPGGNPAGTATASTPRATEAGPMIRDPRLDAYLDAHRQLGSGTWLAAPVVAQKVDRSAGAAR